jgi:hypothetical protein
MSDPSSGSNGFKKWVYVGNKPNAQTPAPAPEPVPPSDVPGALSGSYSPPTRAEAAAAVERAGRILAAASASSAKLQPPGEQPSEASRLLMEIDQTIARLSSL